MPVKQAFTLLLVSLLIATRVWLLRLLGWQSLHLQVGHQPPLLSWWHKVAALGF